ncbi:unnamed protein product [Phyllotreta striolata]|uniref:Uncharacterized protein n=1 Tax=Phyllotreta striolata TaxID=444603 RepID=A0A9N9TJJ3_PHYSR|nr:unnamed protein product [Phyllotreta striolata]
MFARILAMFSVSLICIELAESAPALAKSPSMQYLTGGPGYIPVYIRPGETPLEEINPDLAAAFEFYAQKHGRITFARSIQDEADDDGEIKTVYPERIRISEIEKVTLDEDPAPEEDNKVSEAKKPKDDSKYSNIQKIPRA